MWPMLEFVQVDGWLALGVSSGLLCSLLAQAVAEQRRRRQHEQVLEQLSRLSLESQELSGRLEEWQAKQAKACENGGKPLARFRPAEEELPRVVFSRSLLLRLGERMLGELEKRPNTEWGVALVGRIEQGGGGRVIVVNGMIDAGVDDRSAGHVRFDREYQQRQLTALQALDARAGHIGDAHTHPGSMNECSSGDERTDVANARASASGEMVFVIATDRRLVEGRLGSHPHGNEPDDDRWLQVGSLRMNFFYLGKASGYRYRRIVPRVEPNEPLLEMPESLRAWSERSPLHFRLDLACLRSIPGWTLHLQEEHPASLVLSRREHGEQIIVFLDDYPLGLPRIYVQLEAGEVGEVPLGKVSSGASEDVPWLITLVTPLVQRIEAGEALAVAEPSRDEPVAGPTDADATVGAMACQVGVDIALKDAKPTATGVEPSRPVARTVADGGVARCEEPSHG